MSITVNLEPYLYKNIKIKGRIEKSSLGNTKYYFYADPTKGTEQWKGYYHVALLDGGELVCTIGGYDNENMGNINSNYVLLGIGILHHNEWI